MSVPNTYQLLAICQALQIEDSSCFMADVSKTPELNDAEEEKLREYRADLIASGKYRPKVSFSE